MLIINYIGNKPQQTKYALGVQKDNNAHQIKFLLPRTYFRIEDLLVLLKVQNKESGYYDLINLTDSLESDGEYYSVVWTLTSKSTQYKNLELQIEVVNENEIVKQTEICEIELAETISAVEEVEEESPSILRQLLEKVEEAKQEADRSYYNVDLQGKELEFTRNNNGKTKIDLTPIIADRVIDLGIFDIYSLTFKELENLVGVDKVFSYGDEDLAEPYLAKLHKYYDEDEQDYSYTLVVNESNNLVYYRGYTNDILDDSYSSNSQFLFNNNNIIPAEDNQYSIGRSGKRYNYAYINDIRIGNYKFYTAGEHSFRFADHQTTLLFISGSTSKMYWNIDVLPYSNDSFNLGSGIRAWKTGYIKKLSDGLSNYFLNLPDSTGWSSNKTIATQEDSAQLYEVSSATQLSNLLNGRVKVGDIIVSKIPEQASVKTIYKIDSANIIALSFNKTDNLLYLENYEMVETEALLVSSVVVNSDYFVDKSTNQTVGGEKTFTSPVYFTDANHYIRKGSTNILEIGVNGNTILVVGNSSTSIASTFRPNAHNQKDLGTSDLAWKDLYLAGTGKITSDIPLQITKADSSNQYIIEWQGSGLAFRKSTMSANQYSLKIDGYSIYVYNIQPAASSSYDLGTSTKKFKNLYMSGFLSDGTNTVSVSQIANGIFNVINASDIVSNTLTQEQYDLITNGKPTLIKGTILGYTNIFIQATFAETTYSWLLCVSGLTRFVIRLHNTTFVLSVVSGLVSNLNNIGTINGKVIPAYPSNTGTFGFKQVNGTLSWQQEWYGTQADYDALGTYDSNTMYYIEE